MANFDELKELKMIVNKVQDYVEKNKHAFILPEHLMLILMEDDKVRRMIEQLSNQPADEMCAKMKTTLENFIEQNIEKTDSTSTIVSTSSYAKMLQKTVAQTAARSLEPSALDLFLALFNDQSSLPNMLLTVHGINEDKVRDYVSKQRLDTIGSVDATGIGKYSVELVEVARRGEIDPLIGRDNEVQRVIQVMSKKRSRNPLLVGEAGTGKTAVVEGLALKIANGEVPESIKDKKIYAVNIASMVAGTKFRGEFEKRLEDTLKGIVEDKNAIMFFDELHTVCGAGSGSDSSMDASNILKPYLSSGKISCIGATTYDEYKNNIAKNKAFARRFKMVDIGEPSKAETTQILKGLKNSYEDYHGVVLSDDVLEYIVELSGRYLFDRFFPDKAIDVMDEIGAKYKAGLQTRREINRDDVETVISSMANIPKLTVEADDCDKLKDLDKTIKMNLYGQDEIVDKIVKQVRLSKAGLANVNRPLSVMAIGGTGCGKTELARQLASALGINLVKLDMSEYSEEFSVSKLIGSAAGYVGFEQGGALTEPLIKTPHCVLLLDEIEKANHSVFNLLLQVMDDGRLTDNHGREASFRNAIIIMTSNVGCAEAEATSTTLGFNVTHDDMRDKRNAVRKSAYQKKFAPEFRNRLSDVFYFNPLDEKSLGMIVDKNIRRINDLLKDKNIVVSIADVARAMIVKMASEENAGGRPVEKIIDREVSEKMADEILFGRLKLGGGGVKVDVESDKLCVKYE